MRRILTMLILVAAACGPAHRPTANPNGTDDTKDAVTYDRARCGKDQRVVRLTTRDDGKPDIWKFYASVQEAGTKLEVLVCKQVDVNHDGKVDYVTFYDSQGRLAKEEIDIDFDGIFEEFIFYEQGKVVRKEFDRNKDAKVDAWAYFENEKLVRIEKDSKFRGKIDCWEYYEGGKLDRVGWDTTGTGRVDRWDRAPEEPDEDGAPSAPRPAPSSPPPTALKK